MDQEQVVFNTKSKKGREKEANKTAWAPLKV